MIQFSSLCAFYTHKACNEMHAIQKVFHRRGAAASAVAQRAKEEERRVFLICHSEAAGRRISNTKNKKQHKAHEVFLYVFQIPFVFFAELQMLRVKKNRVAKCSLRPVLRSFS